MIITANSSFRNATLDKCPKGFFGALHEQLFQDVDIELFSDEQRLAGYYNNSLKQSKSKRTTAANYKWCGRNWKKLFDKWSIKIPKE